MSAWGWVISEQGDFTYLLNGLATYYVNLHVNIVTTFVVASDQVGVLHHSGCGVILEQIDVENSCITKNIQCETEYDQTQPKRTIFWKNFKKLHRKHQLRILETLQDFSYIICYKILLKLHQPFQLTPSYPPILKQYYLVLYRDSLKTFSENTKVKIAVLERCKFNTNVMRYNLR